MIIVEEEEIITERKPGNQVGDEKNQLLEREVERMTTKDKWRI
jgi:hypothetical protein